MLITKEVEAVVSGRLLKHFTDLGYEIPKYYHKVNGWSCKKGTKMMIRVEDLPANSHVRVAVLCDYCETEIIDITWQRYNEQKKLLIKKDCCIKCRKFKTQESNNIKYGVDNVFQMSKIKEKSRLTCIDKYDTEWYTQTDESKERYVNTCMEKYNTTNASKNPEIIEKIKTTQTIRYGDLYMRTDECKGKIISTCQEKYGVDNPFQLEEFKLKGRQTCLDKYGVEYLMQIPEHAKEVSKKSIETQHKNGTIASSRQQKYLHMLFGGKLNYPVENCCLDIAFVDDFLYVEYDGSGHSLCVTFGDISDEDFKKKESKRKYFLKSKGWKEIRIISLKDKLPSDEKLFEILDMSKKHLYSHTWIKFDIDNATVETSQGIKSFCFGELRIIKESNLVLA